MYTSHVLMEKQNMHLSVVRRARTVFNVNTRNITMPTLRPDKRLNEDIKKTMVSGDL